MNDSNDSAEEEIGERIGTESAVETQTVTSDAKVIGELDSGSGVGVLGQNNATSGTPIGVQGAVPEPGIGYGLYTLDGAKIDGTTELTTLSGSLTGGQALTDIAGENLSINSGSLDAASGSDTRTDVSEDGTTIESNTSDIDFAGASTVNSDGSGGVVVNEIWTDSDSNSLLGPDGTGITVTGLEDIRSVRSDTGRLDGEVTHSGSALRVSKFESGTDHNGTTTANVTLGSEQNIIWDGAVGGTIAGGGNQAGIGTTGDANDVADHYGTVGGGLNNSAGNGPSDTDPTTAMFATVGGGRNNGARASYATVPGGRNNEAGGEYSLAAGRNAEARAGAFCWGDSSTTSVTGYTDEFVVQAGGGATIYSSSDQSNGVTLAPDGGQWNTASSRTIKNNITPIDPTTVLEGVTSLDLATWEYENQDDVTHMGPMAEDFHDEFGLGHDEEHIGSVDADGVALAAIQGLSTELEETRTELDEARTELEEARSELAEKDARIEALEAERDAVEDRLAAVEDRLATLESESVSPTPADD